MLHCVHLIQVKGSDNYLWLLLGWVGGAHCWERCHCFDADCPGRTGPNTATRGCSCTVDRDESLYKGVTSKFRISQYLHYFPITIHLSKSSNV